MTADQFCDQESTIIHAARSNNWDASTRHHAATCPSCRETVKVLMALVSLKLTTPEAPPAPDPRLIWLKASFARRQKRNALIARFAMLVYSLLGTALGAGVFWIVRTSEIVNSSALRSFHPSGNAVTSLLIPAFLIIALLFVFAPSGRRSPS